MSNEYAISFDELLRETDAAYHIRVGDEDHWLPKSQVRVYPNKKKVYGPGWLFLKKGLV